MDLKKFVLYSQAIKYGFIKILFNLAEVKINALYDEKFHYSN